MMNKKASKPKDDTMMMGTTKGSATGQKAASRPRFEFPFKLHTILEDAAREGNEWIVSWLPHGKAFKVHSRKDFEATILPRYFSAPKYRSFQRQLAMYGFKLFRDRTSQDFRAYYNELFVRGAPNLCKEMMRHVNHSPTRRRRRNKNKPEATPVASASPNTKTPPLRESTPGGEVELRTTEERPASRGSYTAGHPMAATAVPPPRSSLQEEIELLQFSIDANDFLEATSRLATTGAPPLQVQQSPLPLAPGPKPSVPGTISCSISLPSTVSSCSSQSVANVMGAVCNDNAGRSGSSSLYDSLYQHGVKTAVAPSVLGAFFGEGGCSLKQAQDARTAVVSANMLAKIGESLMNDGRAFQLDDEDSGGNIVWQSLGRP